MRYIIIILALVMVGCNSVPKPAEPKGNWTPVNMPMNKINGI